VANIAKELVGAKYIELLSTITWIRREAYAVHVAYRGIRSAKEKPIAGYQVEKLIRGKATWRVLGKCGDHRSRGEVLRSKETPKR
jgi:hypothetical protein